MQHSVSYVSITSFPKSNQFLHSRNQSDHKNHDITDHKNHSREKECCQKSFHAMTNQAVVYAHFFVQISYDDVNNINPKATACHRKNDFFDHLRQCSVFKQILHCQENCHTVYQHKIFMELLICKRIRR